METTQETFTATQGTTLSFNFTRPEFVDLFGHKESIITESKYYSLIMALYKYLSPILLIGGLVGNVLSIVVAQQKAFRGSNFSLLITFLAVADSAVLSTEVLRQFLIKLLSKALADLQRGSHSCEAIEFVTNYARHLAASVVVLVSVERTISVMVPLRSKEICSRRNLLISIGAIVVGIAALVLSSGDAQWRNRMRVLGRLREKPDSGRDCSGWCLVCSGGGGLVWVGLC